MTVQVRHETYGTHYGPAGDTEEIGPQSGGSGTCQHHGPCNLHNAPGTVQHSARSYRVHSELCVISDRKVSTKVTVTTAPNTQSLVMLLSKLKVRTHNCLCLVAER